LLLPVALCAAAALGGCARHGLLRLSLDVYDSEATLARTLRAIDSRPRTLDCESLEGQGEVYEISNYQWARLKAMARKGDQVRETLGRQVEFGVSDDVVLAADTSLGETFGMELTVVEDGCCEYVLGNVECTLRGPGGPRSIAFSCMVPVVRQVLAELLPGEAGGRLTWILIDIREVYPDAPKPDPRKE